MTEPTTGLGRHLKPLIKLLFAAGLMWFVLSQTSCRDSYEVRTKDDAVAKQEYGRIVGDWDAARVSFLPEGADEEIMLPAGEQPGGSEVRILPGVLTCWSNLDLALIMIGACC